MSANGFGTTGNEASILGSSPMVDPQALMATAPGTFFDGNLMLMVPLFASRQWSMAQAANWLAKAALGELSEARADLDLRVTEAFYKVVLADQMVGVADSKVVAAKELVKNTRAQLEAGKGIEAAVNRATAEMAAAEREVTLAKAERTKADLDLKEAMGADLSEDIVVGVQGGPSVVLTLDEALRIGKQSRGTIVAARARTASAEAEVRAARSQSLPQVYGVAMADATNQTGMGGLNAGLTVSLPVFDGGRIAAETRQAKAMKSKAEAQLRSAELAVEKEVRQAFVDVQAADSNVASAEASTKAAESAYEVVSERVAVGKSILVEQLDALQALTQARSDLSRANFELALARARLMRAAGGKQ